MNAMIRKTLRTYSTGMGLPYGELVDAYQQASQVERGRMIVYMKRLEDAWQAELEARAVPGYWRRLWARVVAKVRAWRLPARP